MHTLSAGNTNTTMIDSGAKITYGSSAFTAFWGLFTVQQWIGIAGLIIGLLGLFIKSWFEYKEEKRRQERHRILVAQAAGKSAPHIETDV